MKKIIPLLSFLLSSFIGLSQPKQILMPQPSLPASVKQTIGFTEVVIEYSRPNLKGRNMHNELVPMAKIWRTGANMSTKISFSDEVVINNKVVPKGTYSLWTIPSASEWTIILNTQTIWGTQYDQIQGSDFMRFKVPSKQTDEKIESFQISFANISDSTGVARLEWGHTRVDFQIKDDIHKKLRTLIWSRTGKLDSMTHHSQKDSIYAGTNYWQAAVYCEFYKYEMEKGLEWCDRSMKISPITSFQPALVKAKLLLKLNRTKEAIEAAKNAVELSNTPPAKQRGFHKQAREFLDRIQE